MCCVGPSPAARGATPSSSCPDGGREGKEQGLGRTNAWRIRKLRATDRVRMSGGELVFGEKSVHSAWGSVILGVNGTPGWECPADPEVKPGRVSSRSILGFLLSLHLLVCTVTWCRGTCLLTSQRGLQPASHGCRARPSPRRLPPAPAQAPSALGSLAAWTRHIRSRRMKWTCSRGVQPRGGERG